MRIVLDAMGSDDHPVPDVAGAVLAARQWGDTMQKKTFTTEAPRAQRKP